ncbi:hypothetical protein ACFR9U_14730 [Halorientalis brevis]|uniref:Uncharacterized protein n=1 Tax=Halorientalis brevis TaxID=1126241 RepID=A0ABD6CDZ9_9EURY|nr:hypothetical protein [Halorientalis brevis]
MGRALEPLATQEDLSIQEVYTQQWEPKTGNSARAAGTGFVGDWVVFLVLGSGFEIWVSREGKFDPHL